MQETEQQQAARYWVVIPAAGVGSRMQSQIPKQYLKLGNKTILEYTLDCFAHVDRIAGVFVALSDDDAEWQKTGLGERDDVQTVTGGQERCHSVFNALLHLVTQAGPDDFVLVHDAARPCLRQEDLARLMAVASDADGGLLAAPVRDTMKRGDAHNRIDETVDRTLLWHALTPQLFRLHDLFAALKDAMAQGYLVTDEASAMEFAGRRPQLVEGHAGNIKVTHPDDLSLAEFYLLQQGRI